MSWKNQSYTGGKKFQRVLALGLSDKTEIRADFEDAVSAQLAAAGVAEAIPGNTILLRPEGTPTDLKLVKLVVKQIQSDGAL